MEDGQRRDRPGDELPSDQRRAERRIAIAFGITAACGVALFFVYFSGGQTQLEGLLFGLAFTSLGWGVAAWAAKLLDAREVSEDRHPLTSGPAGRKAFEQALLEEAGPLLRHPRRSFLVKMLVGAGGALGLALLLPALSLGPAPGRSLEETGWRRGKRVVDEQGKPVAFDELPADGYLTVFPEGEAGRADSQALLIKVPAGTLQLSAAQLAGVPGGTHVAYSKICTHAGCPVGLYRAETRSLLCPCHQSQFDVLRGCKPYFGPAARPLPQLPLTVDSGGTLVALGDFDAPVGPAFWHRSKS
ncbi:MAG TPA: Rieske 2Fe-2S domain-containing protein [Actinomycetota bacterium]|nr:Rieske 2Fe-2S domain-containing protein [Actinomycetota bacterium]